MAKAMVSGNPQAKRVREALRSMVDGERILGRIEHCTQVLLSGWEPVMNPATQEVSWVPLDRDRASALGKVMDIQLRLLSKVLPDLKAVELTGADGEPVLSGSTDRLVLATKLLAIMREGTPEEIDSIESTVTGWPPH